MESEQHATRSTWAPPAAPQGTPAHTGYPAYAQQTGYRVPHPVVQGPQSSSRRVAAGVLTIPLMIINGLGAVTMFTGDGVPTGILVAVMALWLLLSIAVLIAGIMLLVHRRGRGTREPRLLLGTTAGLIVVGLIAALLRDAGGPALFSLFFGLPILVLLLTRMKQEAAERSVLQKTA